MKRTILILITLVGFLVFVNAQNGDLELSVANTLDDQKVATPQPEMLGVLFASSYENSDKENISSYRASLTKFIEKAEKKMHRYNNDEYFLKHLFYRVHNKYLKSYKQYMPFDEIFISGDYDCITGTALYSYILEELGYEVKIYESNYHVLVVVELENKRILMEATDFYNGYVNDEEEVAERIEYYKQVNNEEGDYYQFETFSDNFIDLKQLSGLLYFNLAIKQYNGQNFDKALSHLEKAECLYPCERMKEFRNLINSQLTTDQILSSTRSVQ